MSVRFFREFLRNPKHVGAIAPSSATLARTIVRGVGLAEAELVVEYGPGTGAFTRHILEAMKPEARFLAVEQSPELAASFRRRFPEVELIEDSVENLPARLARRDVDAADTIISGLPWAAFDFALQDRLLSATLEVLRPGGHFTTFAYLQGLLLPSGKRFRGKLDEHFAAVSRSRIVWRNLPPAFAYRCRR